MEAGTPEPQPEDAITQPIDVHEAEAGPGTYEFHMPDRLAPMGSLEHVQLLAAQASTAVCPHNPGDSVTDLDILEDATLEELRTLVVEAKLNLDRTLDRMDAAESKAKRATRLLWLLLFAHVTVVNILAAFT